MKKALLVTIMVSLIVTPVYAYSTPLHKLSAGIKQVVTGPFSIITVPNKEFRQENDKVLGFAGGLMEGAVQSAVKPLYGVFNILTFPFVNHEFDPDE